MYQLKVLNIKKDTKDATVVSLDVPDSLKQTFQYAPGQYLTFEFELKGEKVRRSYSLCSSYAQNEALQVAVKRVKNGLVSNHINDHLAIGDTLTVLEPQGSFYATICETNYKTYYLFAGGSGITPILSILKTVLLVEKDSRIHLIYGNSHQDSIIFKKVLAELGKQYTDRLTIVHSLSRPKLTWTGLPKNTPNTIYRKGRVEASAVQWFIEEYPPYAQNAEYYICGPGQMIETITQTLQRMDVPQNRIFSENFGGKKIASRIEANANAALRATLQGQKINTKIALGQTILKALLDAQATPAYSCEAGVCGTCKCKVLSGKVAMKSNAALTEEEIQKGWILTCQALPLSEKIEISF